MGNPHTGKKTGQLKVPVIKTNHKEVQNNFYEVFNNNIRKKNKAKD